MADLRTAEANLSGQRYYASVFFCQQAVETIASRTVASAKEVLEWIKRHL